MIWKTVVNETRFAFPNVNPNRIKLFFFADLKTTVDQHSNKFADDYKNFKSWKSIFNQNKKT